MSVSLFLKKIRKNLHSELKSKIHSYDRGCSTSRWRYGSYDDWQSSFVHFSSCVFISTLGKIVFQLNFKFYFFKRNMTNGVILLSLNAPLSFLRELIFIRQYQVELRTREFKKLILAQKKMELSLLYLRLLQCGKFHVF